jgi:hypothetical protein
MDKKDIVDAFIKDQNEMLKTHGWYIHCLMNGLTDRICGEICNDLIEGSCDMHTHGLNDLGCSELRIVSDYHGHIINMKILNAIGRELVNFKIPCGIVPIPITVVVGDNMKINVTFIPDIDEPNTLRLILYFEDGTLYSNQFKSLNELYKNRPKCAEEGE